MGMKKSMKEILTTMKHVVKRILDHEKPERLQGEEDSGSQMFSPISMSPMESDQRTMEKTCECLSLTPEIRENLEFIEWLFSGNSWGFSNGKGDIALDYSEKDHRGGWTW